MRSWREPPGRWRRGGVAVALALGLLGGCATAPPGAAPGVPAEAVLTEGEAPILGIHDPWNGVNRAMYVFNAEFDRYVFLPVVSAYEAVTPELVQTMVSNFFQNLGQVRTFANALLQFKFERALEAASRFVLNATVGLGGLFDPATHAAIPRPSEDFGQTLGHYGVGEGPYLVLPLFGPSNVRDAAGLVVDGAARSLLVGVLSIGDTEVWAGTGAEVVDTRHSESFRYFETGSPFEYDLIRFLYTRKRRLDVAR